MELPSPLLGIPFPSSPLSTQLHPSKLCSLDPNTRISHFFCRHPWYTYLCVRKEELRVEVEDSRYLIIRTEAAEESTEPSARKFRLPARVDLEAISAGCEDGDLTVTVPRSLRRGFFIDTSYVPDSMEVLARAA